MRIRIQDEGERGFIAAARPRRTGTEPAAAALGLIDPLHLPKRLVLSPPVPGLPDLETLLAAVARVAAEGGR